MGIESTEENCENFHSNPSSNSSSETEMENQETETSSFLQKEDSDSNRLRTSNRSLNGQEETVKRCSRNLSLLVISEGIPLDPEKVAEAIDIVPYTKTESRRGSKLIGNRLAEEDKGNEVSDEEKGEYLRCRCSNYAGILLTLASGLVFTIGGVIVKYLKGYHPFTLAIFRFQGILLPSVFMVLYAYYVQKIPIFETVWPPTKKENAKKIFGMMGRCIFGTTALFLHFYALQRLDVADALVIGACQPVFVTLAAYVFLGEACGIFPVFTALFTIIGVAVISRPPIFTGKEAFDDDALIGAGFSMASMLTATMVFVIIRYLKDVHVSVLTLFLGCWGTIQSIICSVIIGEFRMPESAEHWALALALALITLLGQVGLTLALQCEQAGPVALIRTCDCLFAFVLQFILLNTVPDLYSLTGATIIIFCVILTAFRKWVTTLPKNHSASKRFAFIMK